MARQSKARVFLESITDSGEFLMEAMARTVEYLATFATIYLILEVGITSLQAYATIHNIALGIILSSPELVMIGAYGMAVREIARGNKGGYALLVSVGVLLFLTFLTVFDLMVWHFDASGVNILMAFRFVASIMYAFTRGVVTSKHHNPVTPPTVQSFDPWSFVGWAAGLERTIETIRVEFQKQFVELTSNQQSALVGLVNEDRLAKAIDVQVHKWNLVDLQMQRLLSAFQTLQEEPVCVAPDIDYAQLAKAIMPHLRANIEPAVKAIWEETQSQVAVAPEPVQIEARARSQSQSKGGSRASQKVAPEPEKANANGSPEARLEKAYTLFLANQVIVSGRLLAKEAHVNRTYASKWLSQREKGGSESTTDPVLEAIVTPMSEPVYE